MTDNLSSWQTYQSGTSVFVVDKNDSTVVCRVMKGNGSDESREDKANLIAAAPDLLEALRELFYLIDDGHENERIFTGDIQKKCRAAIAKSNARWTPDEIKPFKPTKGDLCGND